jgi:hypothetical protein
MVIKPEEKRPLGRPRHRWKDNSRMVLREIGWEGVAWLHLAEDRLPYKVGDTLTSRMTLTSQYGLFHGFS